jgi:flagellar hook-length control protein FliK
MSPTAPQPIPTAPGGREPISTGAPPGAPPEGPPFQSALESEWARTAIAEGQQPTHSQDPSSAEGEQASAMEAPAQSPHSAAPPSRRHVGHRGGAPTSGGGTTAGLTPSVPTPAGSAPTPAATPPGGTATNGSAPRVSTDADVNQSPTSGLNTGQPDHATAPGALAGGEAGAPTTNAAMSHGDAPPSLPISSADGAPATPRGSAPTADAPAAPKNDTAAGYAPPAPENGTPSGSKTASAAPAPGHGIAAGAEELAHATPGMATIGDLPIPHTRTSSVAHTPSTSSTSGGRTGNLTKTFRASAPSPSTNVNGDAGLGELSESTASPLVPTAFDGNPALPTSELGAAGYGVGLQEAIESLHGTIQLTARQGLTQARIALQPEELGEIRINLTQTAQGLLARVTAESPAAAQALAAAHAQLRQSLSSLGINLTRLDIGHHDSAQSGGADANGSGQGGATRGEDFAGARPGQSTATAALADPETETDAPAVEAPAPATTAPSHGTLIDVLA